MSGCFWERCSNVYRCRDVGACVALLQAGGNNFGKSDEDLKEAIRLRSPDVPNEKDIPKTGKTLPELHSDHCEISDAPNGTKRNVLAMINEIYSNLDAECCARVDREWAKQRGYILPTNGMSALKSATPPTETELRREVR